MKKFLLATTAALIAAAYVGPAVAAEFDAVPPTFDTYASERIVSGAVLAGTSIGHKLGFGVSNTQDRYLRYTLTNGTFAAKVLNADLTIDPALAPLGLTAAVAQGGNVGDNFVILQITAIGDLPPEALLDLAITGLKVTDKTASVMGNVRLYDGPANAQVGGPTGLLYQRNGTIVAISSGLEFATTQFRTTASVATEYKELIPTAAFAPTDGWIDLDTALIGKLTHRAINGVKNETGNQVLITDLVANGTNVTVTGDLSQVTDLYLGDAVTCAQNGPALTINLAKTSANVVVDTLEFTGQAICANFSGAPIPAETYTIAADIVPAVGADTSDRGPLVLGQIVRDGTVLKHAFAESAAAGTGYSAAVHLTNLSANPAPYTVRCVLNAGSAAGTPGTVAANTAVRQSLAGGMGCAQPNLRGIEVTFAVPEGRVIGAIVRQNTTTGAASFDTMIGSK